MTKPEPTEERWVFLGKRWDRSQNKLVDLWRDESGEERRYLKFSATAVGGIYKVRVSRDGDTTSVHGLPEWTGDAVDDKVALQAEHFQAQRNQEWRRREKRAAESAELDEIVNSLMVHVRDHRDVSVFTAVLTDKMYKALEKRAREKA